LGSKPPNIIRWTAAGAAGYPLAEGSPDADADHGAEGEWQLSRLGTKQWDGARFYPSLYV